MSIIMDLAVLLLLVLSCVIMAKRGFVKAVYSLGANVVTLILLAVFLTPATEAMLKTPFGNNIRENVQKIVIGKTPEVSEDIAENAVSDDDFAPIIKKNLIKNGIENATYNSIDSITKLIVKILTAIVLFILLKLVVALLFKFLGSIFKLPVLAQINTIAGGIAGIINALLIIYIVCAVISLNFDWTKDFQAAADNTLVFKFFYTNNLLINLFI